MSTWAVLERHFDGLSPDEVDAELAAVPPQGSTPASTAAADYLSEHGGPDLDDPASGDDLHHRRTLTAARTLAETLRSALTLDQVAATLSVSRSRISHRLADATLWGFTVQGRRFVPGWQLTGGHTIPGLASIVPVIPSSLHPLALDAFMTTASDDFGGQSPVEWLISGGDPSVVADWLAGMAHG
jgi:hypothetical protein